MAIDYDSITRELIGIAVDHVGAALSQQPAVAGTRPAVIRARNNPKSDKPELPYVVIDILDTSGIGGWLTNLTFDNTGEDLTYEVDKNVLFRFTVYDKEQWGSNKIMNDLHGIFNFESVRQRMEAINASVIDTQIILSLPEPLATNFQGVSAFDLVVSTKDIIADATNGVIDNIEATGDLCRTEDDLDPLVITPIIIP